MSKKRFVLGLLIVVGVVSAAVLAPNVIGQSPRDRDGAERRPGFQLPFERGSQIGASVRDLEQPDVAREKLPGPNGALVERLDTEGPAAKAGLKAGDIVVEFDGERVRSALHLTRLVRETPEGRAVKVTVVRDGARTVVDVAPVGQRALGPDESLWREPMRNLEEFGRNFDFKELDEAVGRANESLMGWNGARGRLGVSVQVLTPQLATYFAVKDGLLVTSVTEESPAARAGLKAGDVITSVNGKPVTTRSELVRVLRDVEDNTEASIELSRERKPIAAKVKLDPSQERRRIARAREL